MSFTDLKKDELVEAAEYYEVDFKEEDTKAEIASALEESGVSESDWESVKAAREGAQDDNDDDDNDQPRQTEPEEEEEDEDPVVLVRFQGKNQSYRTGKSVFTRDKPFALMRQSQADRLNPDLFREATKREAREYYGR